MSKGSNWRLIFRKNNKMFKFCGFWGSNNDNSLYLKIYSKENRPLHTIKALRTETENKVNETIKYCNVDPTDFYSNKISFHPTGYIHTTNRDGDKFELGIKSLPFDKIINFRLLALIFPQAPEKLIEIRDEDVRKNDVVLDMNIFDYAPFMIEVYIVRADIKKYPPNKPEAIKSADIFCEDTGVRYTLFIKCYQSKVLLKGVFPPYSFIGKAILKEKI